MKKQYESPEISVIDLSSEPVMLDTSVVYGGDLPGGAVIDAKGGFFDDDEEDEEWPWP